MGGRGSGARFFRSANRRGAPSSTYTGRESGWNQLAENLSQLSRLLQDEKDVDSTLHAILKAAVDTIPGVEHASISLVVKREIRTRIASDDLARAADQAQYDAGEGPCLDSLYEQRTVRVDDLEAETRWPSFTARARELGLGSTLAVQLYVAGEDFGALNLHSTRRNAFDDESEQIALLFAAHAAVALAGAQEQEHLRIALTSRDVIGQAKAFSWSATGSTPMTRSGCWSASARPATSDSAMWPSTSPRPESCVPRERQAGAERRQVPACP